MRTNERTNERNGSAHLDSVFSNCSLLRRFVCGRAKSIEHHSAFLWCKSAHAPHSQAHLSYSCSFEVFAHFAFIAHRNTVVLIRQLLLLHYIYLPILLSPFRSSPSIYPSMPLSLCHEQVKCYWTKQVFYPQYFYFEWVKEFQTFLYAIAHAYACVCVLAGWLTDWFNSSTSNARMARSRISCRSWCVLCCLCLSFLILKPMIFSFNPNPLYMVGSVYCVHAL